MGKMKKKKEGESREEKTREIAEMYIRTGGGADWQGGTTQNWDPGRLEAIQAQL